MISPKTKRGTKSLQYHSKNRDWFLDQLIKHTDLAFSKTITDDFLILKTFSGELSLLDDDWIVVYPDNSAEILTEYEYSTRYDSA